MGIRNRTTIGTLREQRRSAESTTQALASPAKASVRRAPRAALDEQSQLVTAEKSDNLIERLRSVLQSENSKSPEGSFSDYQVIQDELSRISQHQQANRVENARDIVDLEPPRKHIETSAPFRYVVIDGGKTTKDFLTNIPQLDRAPSSLEFYTRELPKDVSPRIMPLTLLISAEEAVAPVKTEVPRDASQEAAHFTQSTVTYPSSPKKGSVLPKSLVLTLLDDK